MTQIQSLTDSLAETVTDTPAPATGAMGGSGGGGLAGQLAAGVRPVPPLSRSYSILLVDDDSHVRRLCALALAGDGVVIHESDNGVDALALVAAHPYDLVLLDMNLPRMHGEDVLRRARGGCAAAHMKVMVLSGQGDFDHLSTTLAAGADDFIPKPFTIPHLRARVRSLLRLKDAQDRSDQLTECLAISNTELDRALTGKDDELLHARRGLVLALARLAEARSNETGPHLRRLQKYSRVLGEAAAARPKFAARLSEDFLRTVESAAPLHDIGKVAVPDYVLNKPGRLTDDERRVMQGHAAAGADTLLAVTSEFPFAVSFFHAAIEIARYHHERWDGNGYPQRLAGEAIPLSARLVAIGDVYDALRSPRVYKPPMDHAAAVAQMIASHASGHFDPDLFEVFLEIADQFDRVYSDTAE